MRAKEELPECPVATAVSLIGGNAEEIYRKSRLRKKVTVDVKGI